MDYKDKIKLLIIVSSFPKPPNLMNLSPWALEQTKELAKLVDCTVVSPTPNFWISKPPLRQWAEDYLSLCLNR